MTTLNAGMRARAKARSTDATIFSSPTSRRSSSGAKSLAAGVNPGDLTATCKSRLEDSTIASWRTAHRDEIALDELCIFVAQTPVHFFAHLSDVLRPLFGRLRLRVFQKVAPGAILHVQITSALELREAHVGPPLR